MPRIIAVAYQKGGVGKTTTVLNLGASLALKGRKVLLVDCDPQGCLGLGLGIQTPPERPSITQVLFGQAPLSDVLVQAHGMTLAPAGLELVEAEGRLYADPVAALKLREALRPLARTFDYVLIDCPPNLGPLTVNALVAAHEVLVPVQTEVYALYRLGVLEKLIEALRPLNEGLRVVGVLPTMYDGRTLHSREILAMLQTAVVDRHHLFEPIPRNVRLADSALAAEPVATLEPESAGATAYARLAEALDTEQP